LSDKKLNQGYEPSTKLNKLRRTTGDVFSKSSGTSKLGAGINKLLFALILLNLVAIVFESVESVNNEYKLLLYRFELFSVAIFSLEYLLRVWSAPDNSDFAGKSNFQRRFNYATSFTGLIDFIAILPSLLQMFGLGGDLRVLRVLRMARLLKLSHYTTALEDLASAIYSERRAFLAALYIILIALFMSSSLIYLVENEVQPEAFPSIPETMWWSIITLTTVGYGDVSPMTGYGKLIGAATAMVGVCSVALLTGIVGAGFSKQMSKQSEDLHRATTKAAADGRITEEELQEIVDISDKLGLSPERVQELVSDSIKSRKNETAQS
jgi:voltage-gated potassium channel